MWYTILINVLNSVLWLLNLNDAAEKHPRTFAEGLNFATSNIIFADFIPKDKHLKRIQSAGMLYSNAHSCNGHIACLDALWTGVQVFTLPGNL